ncbi:aminodeoxychorismate synthase component I [Smaragdicoccus niigatensis]|uniref:aminodeoxychorismate synthase component I n=1 Tax=Smaragdicoccus niigatensis TaxID=359359 RepID=UPI00036118C9|nr:aminodeoxychorismate synthase component I [Smaragdicoccus niigatensis]
MTVRLHVRRIDRAIDPEAAFERLFGDAENAFWLDRTSAVSYLGASDDVIIGPHAFDELAPRLRDSVESPELPFDFLGGFVGYFGYEMKAACGSPVGHRSWVPDAGWICADRYLAIDHIGRATYSVSVDPDWAPDLAEIPDDQPVAYETAVPDLHKVEAALSVGRTDYMEDVRRCQAQLQAGESYEICLTNHVVVDAIESGFAFYRRLRRSNPAPEAAYLRFGTVEVACSSPERFLRIDPGHRVETRPIKGTARRGATPEEDAALRDSLLSDPKIAAENLIIVDLLRNDLGRVCLPGSVKVPELMVTETYPTVHQLVSTIRGQLRPEATVLDCVRACFPGGSMTGAPKIRTLEIIDELEPMARGIYSGTIGYLSLNGAADLNVVIRTAVFADGQMHVGAGGAIVLDSDPHAEFDEVVLKAAATLRVDSRFNQ